MHMRSKIMILALILAGSPVAMAATKSNAVAKPVKAERKLAIPRLLDLGADRCIPCKMMQPILAELRKQYAGKVQVDFIDVWKDEGAAAKYKVRSIPTQIFFDKSGKEVFRHVGFYSKDAILAKLAELGLR